MTVARISGTPNLVDAIRQWRALGGHVYIRRRSGEAVFWHPEVGRDCCNSRRKDTPRAILAMLRRLVEVWRRSA